MFDLLHPHKRAAATRREMKQDNTKAYRRHRHRGLWKLPLYAFAVREERHAELQQLQQQEEQEGCKHHVVSAKQGNFTKSQYEMLKLII